jgi:hypothetical protein
VLLIVVVISLHDRNTQPTGCLHAYSTPTGCWHAYRIPIPFSITALTPMQRALMKALIVTSSALVLLNIPRPHDAYMARINPTTVYPSSHGPLSNTHKLTCCMPQLPVCNLVGDCPFFCNIVRQQLHVCQTSAVLQHKLRPSNIGTVHVSMLPLARSVHKHTPQDPCSNSSFSCGPQALLQSVYPCPNNPTVPQLPLCNIALQQLYVWQASAVLQAQADHPLIHKLSQ